jgi:signal transduction histidine kinase
MSTQQHGTISALSTRMNAARWVLWGNALFAALGIVLHFLLARSAGTSVNWLYQALTLGIVIVALFSLRWLQRSLSQAMHFAAWASMFGVLGMVFSALGVDPHDPIPIIFMLHVGVFALGFILGFRAAVRYATAVALAALLIGLVYDRVVVSFVYMVLAYSLALPGKVVERLIEESTTELSNINVKLRREIGERRRAEQELRQHREHLEELVHERTAQLEARNEELDAFAHTVAHDLKSPLSVVMGYAETLRDFCNVLPEEELQGHLWILERNGRKMRSIIEELMLLAGVREMEVEPEPLDMAGIVAEASNRLGYMIEEQRVEIVAPSAECWPAALGYGPWVEEVWVNYISNAIRYGGDPPWVELGFDEAAHQPGSADSPVGSSADPMIHFWVRDNGGGLTPEEQTRLFTPFTQLSQVRARGHGLGLSIVRRIVEKLDGQVWVESNVGQGSTFFFALPRVGARLEGDQRMLYRSE